MKKTPDIERRITNAQRRPVALLIHELSSAEYGANTPRKYDLEDRLLDFAVQVIGFTEALPNTRAANHIAGQLLRSGTSPYGHRGEVESAEPRKDFVRKLKVCLKELRETRRWLRLVGRLKMLPPPPNLVEGLNEADELIRIFVASIRTAAKDDK